MDVDPADPPPHQPVRLDERQGLLVTSEHGLGERCQEREDLLPSTEVSARKFPGHKGVGPDFAEFVEQLDATDGGQFSRLEAPRWAPGL